MTTPRALTGSGGSVTIATAATLITDARPSRKSILIQNVSTQDVYVGYTSAVATSTGIKITPGSALTDDLYTGPMYGIVAAATSDVRYIEVY